MTPPRSIIGSISHLNRPNRRRTVLAVLVLICALLTAFPERYRAAVTMTPTDPSSLGLSGALGQLGALNSAFGNQAAVEVSMKVARSVYVRENVIRRLNLIKRMSFSGRIEASRWLERNVGIRTMRGGILQIEIFNRDPVLGREIVAAYQDATQSRLGEVARRQTAYKRQVLIQLFEQANSRLDQAQNAYDTFRLRTRYSDPAFAMSAIGGRIPVLEAAIKAKEVELNAARQFATEDNMTVRQITAQIDALRRQLAQFRALSPTGDNSIGRVVEQSTRAMRLERELRVAQSLYDGYKRYLEGTAVEDLTATATVRILEPPFIDTARQWNLPPLALGILLILFGLAIEFYQLRPPVDGLRAQA